MNHRWISITEQLPPLYEKVLFCAYVEGSFGFVDVGWYEGGKTLGDAIAIETDGDWYPCTHWMPLPLVPEVP